jgi:DNA-binding NarL/FixJ family response regulator
MADVNEQTALLDLIGEIYESSYDPSHWVSVLQGIAEATGSSSAALVYRDEAYPRANFVYSHGVSPAALDAYLTRYIHQDPFVDLIVRGLPRGAVSADHLLLPGREAIREVATEFYDEFMIPHDLYHIGGAGLMLDGERMGAIAIQRKQVLGPWQREQLDRLACLTPHLQRAFHIHREFTRLRTQEYAVYALLDQLVIGLVLMDATAKALYINPAAHTILKTHPGLHMHAGRVAASRYQDAQTLTELIRSAADSHGSIGEPCGGVVSLRHMDSPLPLLVLVTPVTDLKAAYQAPLESARVAMFISDPERHQAISTEALIEAFALTKAEAEVAVALANGMAVKEIATAKGTSPETVRVQLKAIYRKTGTRSQAGLVRLVLSGLFAVVQQ